MGPASRGRCRSEYHSVFAILAVVSNLHVIRICVAGQLSLMASSLRAWGSPPAHPTQSLQKERKQNKTNRPLFPILDNGFSKVLRNHLSTFLLPGESKRCHTHSRAVHTAVPTGGGGGKCMETS